MPSAVNAPADQPNDGEWLGGNRDCRGSPAVRDTRVVKLYFAGPLFTTPERTWNAEICAALRAAGHEVFLPQEQEPGKDGPGIFATDVGGIEWADGLVAIRLRFRRRLTSDDPRRTVRPPQPRPIRRGDRDRASSAGLPRLRDRARLGDRRRPMALGNVLGVGRLDR